MSHDDPLDLVVDNATIGSVRPTTFAGLGYDAQAATPEPNAPP